MSEEKLANLLASMRGSRFEEFTVRAASFRLSFFKIIEGKLAAFHVETNGEVCDTEENCSDDIVSMTRVLVQALELKLEGVRKLPSNAFRFEFENGVKFCITDTNHMWDNIFSVRTADWPELGAHEIYFFL